MYCTRKVADDLIWVGADDRRLAMFEGVYSVPRGVSYNSYLLLDEKTVVFDTVDHAVEKTFLENVEHGLNGRTLDYLVVQHMEPDHSATIRTLLMLYPEAEVVCSKKTEGMLRQFFGDAVKMNIKVVGEGDTLKTGKHEFTFLAAPMVHWPEVIVTYDLTTKTLFSADAFGTFGALNGALFADEVDFFRDYLDEARRYYTNIVGKYGVQVQALLKKAATVEIKTICPLHGFVWRENIGAYLEKYQKWSLYEPEVSGVMIAYASVYGNTENAANILACKLRDKGIKTTIATYFSKSTPSTTTYTNTKTLVKAKSTSLNSPTLVKDSIYRGKYFDGTNIYLTKGFANTSLGSKLSVVVRFKVKSFPSDYMELVANTESAGFDIYVSSDKKLYFDIMPSSSSSYSTINSSSSSSLSADTWYVVVGTYDGTTQKLYFNGKLVASKSLTGAIKPSTTPIIIGADPDSSGGVANLFKGVISDVIVIKDALSESTISSNYAQNVNYVTNANTIINESW